MNTKVSEEQLLYSKLLNTGMLIGLGSLLVAFLLYCTGIPEPLIPHEKIPDYWILPVGQYLEQSGWEAGWTWIEHLGYSDMLNFLPIAMLSLLTIICYASIIPSLVRKKDKAYLILVVIEIIVLIIAASGILGSAGH